MTTTLIARRVRSGATPPYRHVTNDQIIADHGLHVVAKTASTTETAWTTLVTLHLHGGLAGRIWVHADLDDPLVEDAIVRLDRWHRVLAALGELDGLERHHQALTIEAEGDAVLNGGMPGAYAYGQAEEVGQQLRTLRAVTIERARTLGNRAQLVDVEVIEFDLLYPRRLARYEVARHDLIAWRERKDDRDAVVREAIAAGLSDSEIQRLSGVARTTINRI